MLRENRTVTESGKFVVNPAGFIEAVEAGM